MTWASVCSTKRFNRSEYKVVFLLLFTSPLIPHPPNGSLDDSLLYSILHDPFYENLDHGAEKKEIAKASNGQRHSFGDWVLGLLPHHFVTEVGSIGCRCDSETFVASRILGELKTDVWHTFRDLSMTAACVRFGG